MNFFLQKMYISSPFQLANIFIYNSIKGITKMFHSTFRTQFYKYVLKCKFNLQNLIFENYSQTL